MKKLISGMFLLLLLTVPAFADNLDDQALSSALTFASTIDDGNFQAAYWMASPLLHLMVPEQLWIDKTDRTQQVLGQVLQRELKLLRKASSPSNFPDDDYRMIYFESRTERKSKASEVILLHLVDGLWRVCEYSIR